MKVFPDIYALNECSDTGVDITAPSIFLAGCNLRCQYCMNAPLIAKKPNVPVIALQTVKDYVIKDKSEWVMISGGEPTCTDLPILINLLEEIKSWGCKIGLSTNGTNCMILKSILPYLGYVALDIKSGDLNKGYGDQDLDMAKEIICSKLALYYAKNEQEGFDFEIRTTLYPLYINEKSLREIGGIIRKDETWVLQQFRKVKYCEKNIKVYNKETVEKLLNVAKEYSDKTCLRYV